MLQCRNHNAGKQAGQKTDCQNTMNHVGSVAGKAHRMARIVRGVMNLIDMRKTGQENQRRAKRKCDERCLQSLAFPPDDRNCNRCHLMLPGPVSLASTKYELYNL